MIPELMAKSKTKTLYVCQNCGAQRSRWEGKCSDCGAWNSYVEEMQAPEPASGRGWSIRDDKQSLQSYTLDQSMKALEMVRQDTGTGELNRVLGGGLVQGSFVLLGGAPGIGKSTLLIQMAGGLASNEAKVLYISGEESVAQTGSRAHRLGIKSPLVEIAAESELNQIIALAQNRKPDVLIVDSIQTIYLSQLQAAPGSVSQVRECAGHLMMLAKQQKITVLLIGHITKDGNLAGPKVLEHMVDTVLQFEGDMSYNFRLLRTIKNRFGSAQELGVFQMTSRGLEEVTNPSEMFLEERGENPMGSAVFASMEGTRPLLCEIQALTLQTQMPQPRRTALGIDINRLHMLTAVLDRHLDVQFYHSDIYINVVGGLRLVEPASDLAVAAALLSTENRAPIGPKVCFFGEVGLTGEIRAVSFAELRLKEGLKLGFTTFFMPESNKKHLSDIDLPRGVKIVYLKQIRDLVKMLHSNKNKASSEVTI